MQFSSFFGRKRPYIHLPPYDCLSHHTQTFLYSLDASCPVLTCRIINIPDSVDAPDGLISYMSSRVPITNQFTYLVVTGLWKFHISTVDCCRRSRTQIHPVFAVLNAPKT
ncbi:hypothetical protein K443DRAFT_403462 [Laccaria amethystina LaAM-08-1]|uniref:Uncharacterized protein n=1 Tax=Laccaria amethystina LaAM-08-1 TaxID=1095629 RepID=A0A0C9Y9C2_9AGAR|nr:hypothetical protein K443DRAFT_403462 [Laccaria amethystina LaAM-08-1]